MGLSGVPGLIVRACWQRSRPTVWNSSRHDSFVFAAVLLAAACNAGWNARGGLDPLATQTHATSALKLSDQSLVPGPNPRLGSTKFDWWLAHVPPPKK
jgi:hypothetical protein